MPNKRKKGRLTWSLVIVGTALLASEADASPCLKYEPVLVTVSGTIAVKQAYGPPGYGEDPKHDTKEKYLLLILTAPLCVDADPGDPLNSEAANNVKAIQMFYMPEHPFNKAWLGQPVTVTGTLFRAQTGHHRTDVLIEVNETRPGISR